MSEYPLCEEMGLTVKAMSDACFTNAQVIHASDVEKMLKAGNRLEQRFNWNMSVGRGPVITEDTVTNTIVLTVPKKPKPVKKSDLISIIKALNNLLKKSDKTYCGMGHNCESLEDLIIRAEKNGIE